MPAAAPVPPSERVALILAHHVHDLPRRQAQVLVLQALGLDDGEVAACLRISRSTVQNHAAAARMRVVPAELPPTRVHAQLWVYVRRECCVATEWARHTNGARFG